MPESVEVIVDTLDVELTLPRDPAAEIVCAGYVHGFGLPASKIRVSWEYEKALVPTLRYRVDRKGWFTDIDSVAHIRFPWRNLRKTIVRVGRGDIRVDDETGGQFEAARLSALDQHTANGHVRQPERRSRRS